MTSPHLSTPITPLSRPTSTTLRSTLVIPTFPQTLSELVQNALDAGSTRIDCWIDTIKGGESVRVEDDGCGISLEGLKRVGNRYESSKGLSESRLGGIAGYGFRGEALSSVAALGLVDITTKVKGSRQAYTKVIKSAKTLFEGKSSRSIPGASGTVVLVKDLFHQIPVRRAVLSSSSATSTMNACRKIVGGLALVHPEVRWSLWEETGGLPGGTKRFLSINGSKTSIDVFRNVYGAAAVEKAQSIHVSSGKRRIDGFISLEGLVSKSHQHLYVNGFPIERGDLQHAISKRFAASRFSITTTDSMLERDCSHKKRSPRRLKRYPIYVLNVTLPFNHIDVAHEPRKSNIGYQDFESVKVFVLTVVDEFLRRHGFARSGDEQTEKSPTKPHPGMSARASSRSPSRANIPTRPRGMSPATRLKSVVTHARPVSAPQFHKAVSSLRPDSEPPLKRRRESASGADEPDDWLDAIRPSVRNRAFPVCRPGSSSPIKRPTVATADSDDHGHCVHENSDDCHHSLWMPVTTQIDGDVSLSASSLSCARILDQVDKKFIPCVIDSESRPNIPARTILVVIDQHAADERVSVEGILQDLCVGFARDAMPTRQLKIQPMLVLSREEGRIMVQPMVIEIFRRWGVVLGIPESTDSKEGEYIQVAVKAVPETLATRLGRKEAVEITRLIKLHLTVLQESIGELQALLEQLDKKVTMDDWRRLVRWMPKEMLELAKSKACRGAIMFGDRLNREQCGRLVDRLSSTRQPFMCAHGRPSVAPLAVLNGRMETKRRIDWPRWKERLERLERLEL